MLGWKHHKGWGMRTNCRKTLDRPNALSKLVLGAGVLCAVSACAAQAVGSETALAVGAVEAQPDKAAHNVVPENWPLAKPLALDPAIESRVAQIMARMSLEQKIGQLIQADSSSITPEELKQYRLGSVLSGGNSAPGPLAYADTETWLELADAYHKAAMDPDGVDIAIPIILGIDAVHGHANLKGATVFPHNIGLGAMHDPALIEKIYAATARELLVSGHDWTFAPTLAVPRDDRWGRAYEGFSENPALVASYATPIVEGLQGERGQPDFLGPERVLASAKHFLADGATINGMDQGDAQISEAELRDIHAAGYYPAIAADVQSIMVSFSSWHGRKMSGNRELLTDVLRRRMGFRGFVVSDWNAHGQILGCSNTDCPAAINAGIDMLMAPDSWRDLYHSTLAAARDGRIAQARIDEAVRRILRVKLNAGLFERGLPSERIHAGNSAILASPEHRAIAREAVRSSLVLLKNEGSLLPLDPGARIVVVGDGANSIAKASGGWTLSWQGKGHSNDEFPNGQTILSGIQEAASAAGGSVLFVEDGNLDPAASADVVIAVYGEDPYAEFQGDRADVDFEPNGFDPGKLAELRARGLPIVSVFLSGRPLWTNPEINASDAFIAAWLPGSEGGGIADMLFRTDPSFEFSGRLPFSWPRNAMQATVNIGDSDYNPQFPYGYGLSYGDESQVAHLSEESGLSAKGQSNTNSYFARGAPVAPWSLFAITAGTSTRLNTLPWDGEGLAVSGTDRATQEDSLRVDWRTAGETLRISSFDPVDLSRQSNGDMELVFSTRSFDADPRTVSIGMGCLDAENCDGFVSVTIADEQWQEHRIRLKCFARQGVDMSKIGHAFIARSSSQASIGLSDIRLEADDDGMEACGDQTTSAAN